MLRIRLQRFGKKKAPIYRLVVTEKANKRDGQSVEVLGYYNPKNKELVYNKARAEYWKTQGAQASDTAAYLVSREPDHDLANGPYQAKPMSRKDKEQRRVDIATKRNKNTKAKKKKAEAAAASSTESTQEA